MESPRKFARLDGDHHQERQDSQDSSIPSVNIADPKPEHDFVDGPGHIVFIDEGGKRCPAICFNEMLLREFNDIAVNVRKIREKDKEIRVAQDELEKIISLDQSADIQEAKRTVEEAIANLKHKEARIPELVEAQRRCDSLAEDNKWSKRILEGDRHIAQYMVEGILDRGNLLRIPTSKLEEPVENNKDHSAEPAPFSEKTGHETHKSTEPENNPAPSITRQESPIITELQFTPRQLALRHLRWTREELYNRKEHFDFIQEEYAQEVAAEIRYRQQQYPDRPASTTQTDIDLQCLQQQQGATRELIQAEEDFDRAEQHAQTLGLGDILADPQACYWGEYYNNFPPRTPDSPSMFPVDQPRIEAWMDSVPDFTEADRRRRKDVEAVVGDEWEAKSVGISDSVSLVAYDMYRKKIDRWREIASHIGEGDAGEPLPGTMRQNPRRRCRGSPSSARARRRGRLEAQAGMYCTPNSQDV